jgi:hypothetical protein
MSSDDLVILDLSGEVAELRERLALAAIFRELAKEAVERLAQQNAELEAARRRIASLVAELRELRATVTA